MQKSGPIFVAQDAVESVVRWEDAAKTSFFAAAWAILCKERGPSCPSCFLSLTQAANRTEPNPAGYWPSLVVLIPNVVLVSILLTTYRARKERGDRPPPESQDGPTPLAKDPPSEGSVDYFANLVRPSLEMRFSQPVPMHADPRDGRTSSSWWQQNIQIMMGRVADVTDVLRSFVPYLTWRDERLTRCLLLLSILSSFLLASIAHSIPWRLVFLLVGESTLLCGHPLVRTFLADAKHRGWTPARRKRFWNGVERLLEDDELRDDELDCEVVEVQKIEVESRVGPGASSSSSDMSGVGTAGADSSSANGGGGGGATGSTSPSLSSNNNSNNPSTSSADPSGINNNSTNSTEGWQTEAIVGGDLPSGFRWLGSHWQDAIPSPPSSSSSFSSEGGAGLVDAHGWTYIFLDGSRAPTPTKMVPAPAPATIKAGENPKDRFVVAQTRRRRLVRRAIKNPLL